MIRLILPVTICLAAPLSAQTLSCENILHSQDNCMRAMIWIGCQSLHFDRQAPSWDTGPATGTLSNGVQCFGEWTTGGPVGAGMGRMQCDDGNTNEPILMSDRKNLIILPL